MVMLCLLARCFSPGEWFSYVCADEVADGFTNVATATAMWNAQQVDDVDDAVVEVINPDIEITKDVLTDFAVGWRRCRHVRDHGPQHW